MLKNHFLDDIKKFMNYNKEYRILLNRDNIFQKKDKIKIINKFSFVILTRYKNSNQNIINHLYCNYSNINVYNQNKKSKIFHNLNNYIFLMENKVLENKNIKVISTESTEVFNKERELLEKNNTDIQMVGTHSGCFHADEVLATVLIKYIPQFKNMWIIRSRNKTILEQTKILVDVGGKFEPESLRFDHHMREFNHVHDDVYKIKLSSAGLIYKHFGISIIENILKNLNLFNEKTDLNIMYDKLYVNFIAYVDGQDNGIDQYPSDITPRYQNNTSFGHRISRVNPEWCEPNADQSQRFKLAMDIAEGELLDQIKFIARVFFPAYSIVKEAVQKRFEIHNSGKILYFDVGLPWKSHLQTIEEQMDLKDQIVFGIVKNSAEDYRVCTIPTKEGSFKFRKGIVKSWRGLELNKLAEVSGINDIIFVHTNGFIGGAKTLESAVKIAELSLNEPTEE